MTSGTPPPRSIRLRAPGVRRLARAVAAALALLGAAGVAGPASADDPAGPARPPAPPAAPPPPAPPPSGAAGNGSGPAKADWLAEPGTAVLGLGLLRVSPAKAGTPGTLRLRYEERPDDYAAFDCVQMMVLPGDAFKAEGRCFADRAVAFSRSAAGAYEVVVEVAVTTPALLAVGYGPFTGPDTGRSLSLARTYTLEVAAASGVSHRWVDPEAGELNVKGWTARPEVRRGGGVLDPVTKAPHFFEARPEILYDRERLRAPSDGDTPETQARRREADTLRSRAKDLRAAGKPDAAKDLDAEADDVLAQLAASDDRLPVPEGLAARLRRLPFRWK